MSSYISILIPAFHLNTSNIQQIQIFCCKILNISQNDFELLTINDKIQNNIYCIKFIDSNLSLSSLSELIYQKNCLSNISNKSIESLKAITSTIIDLENQINLYKKINNNTKKENNIILKEENEKLRKLLNEQIKSSENFRINTENTIIKMKQEFKQMIKIIINQQNKNNIIKKNGLNLNIDNNSNNYYFNFGKSSNLNSELNISDISNIDNNFTKNNSNICCNSK